MYTDKVIMGVPEIPIEYEDGDPMGAITGGTVQPNLGGPGTYWGEYMFNGLCDSLGQSRIGDYLVGQVIYPYSNPSEYIGQIVDKWYTGYLNFGIQPRQNLTGFKFRFIIEHF